MALQRAEKLITQNTRAEELTLENMGLDSIAPLLPLLSQMTRLRRLKLGKNSIAGLPDDLSSIRQVEYLDISGNPVAGLNAVIKGLYSMPNLKHLFIDLQFESEEDEVIVSLQSLESFNGTPLTENYDGHDGGGGGGGAAESSRQVATAVPGPARVGAPRQAWEGGPSSAPGSQRPLQAPSVPPSVAVKTRWDDADMQQVQRLYQAVNSVSGRVTNKNEFDEYTRNVVNHLHSLVAGEDDPFKREVEILKAKRILFEYCFEEVARSSHRFDANLSSVLGVVQEAYSNLLENYEKLGRNVLDDKERKLDVMKTDMQAAIQEIETLMGQMDSSKAGGQAADGAAASNAKFDAERRRLNEEIGWLRAENEKLQTRVRQADVSRGLSATPGRNVGISPAAGGGAGSTFGSDRGAPQLSPAKVPAIGSKVLTQRQLHEVIEDIYASKSKYDIKCAETHLPRETMEQHMYTFLNQKYGLKHIILEWATAIIQGIKKYGAEDNDVAVFGKILRNEIDEEFRFVQRQLKETVHELLRVYVKGKRPLKSDEEINAIVKKKVHSTLLEEEWIDIVKYMYNNEDAVSIIMRIRDILKMRAMPQRRRSTAAPTRGAPPVKEEDVLLSYNEFIRTLLDFQLEGHERFLSRFVRIFKQFDADRNGIVNELEFRNILRGVDPQKTEEAVTALLDVVDPHNNQLITFSECVTFLSTELVRMMREEGVTG
jgi:hypothetical protein